MECNLCNKCFINEFTLSNHKLKFHSEIRKIKLHECVVCEKSFLSSLKLTQHLKNVHTASESIQCSLCPKLCLGRLRLETHIKSSHTNSKSPLPCKTCGKVFYKKMSWRRHLEVAHDDSRTLCDLCGRFFRGRRGLMDHMRYKHANTGSFVCEPCNKVFDTEKKLLRHLNMSSKHVTLSNSFYCEICGKGFRYSCSFNRHLQTHTKKRLFQCEVCGKTFSRENKLRCHINTHNLNLTVRGNKSLTSNPIWSVLPHLTVNESSMEMVQPHHGNHFLMDLIHQSPSFSGFNIKPIKLPPSLPYLPQNIDTRSVSSCSPKQKTTERMKSSNDDSDLLVNSQLSLTPNVHEITMNKYEPSTIDNNQMQGNLNFQTNEFSYLPINKTLNVKTNQTLSDKLTLNSTNLEIIQHDETVSNEIPNRETSLSDNMNPKPGEFFCRICDTDYWTAERFSFHLEQNEFTCRICTKEFTSHSDLKVHFLTHRGYRCGDCKEYFLCKQDLCNHRKSSLVCTSKFECNICNKIYSSVQSVRVHKQDAHRNVKKYNCTVCDSKFTLPFKLNSHLKRYHVAYENIECTLCNMSVLGPEKLRIHKRLYHLRKKEACLCSKCSKVFYCKDSLMRHEKSHRDTNEIVCEFCGKSCKGSKALTEHIQYNHSDSEQVHCHACNREFKSMKCFKRHEKFAHKPKLSVICEVCGKTLKNRSQLKTHLQIHSSERHFKCGVCNATFKQALSLKNHSRIHSSICKYNCNNCGKSFKWKQTFDKHKIKCTVFQRS